MATSSKRGGKSSPARKRTAGKKASPKRAPKKGAPKKARKKKAGRAPNLSRELKKILLATLILAAICLTGAMVADILLNRVPQVPPPGGPEASAPATPSRPTLSPVYEDISDVGRKAPQTGLKEKGNLPILYEVFDDIHEAPPEEKQVPAPPKKDDTPRITLIIDDIGYDRKLAMALFDLEPKITFSVLPWSPFGRSISKKLNARGGELMLHLPMEPAEYPDVNPGPGALLASMPPDVLLNQLRKNLAEVPGAAGVNNHMGSRLTTESNQMNQIFTILKKSDLFFIDSRTAAASQCRASARLLQIRFAERDVFLDNVQDVAYITGQFEELKRIALKHGVGIGIGHPYQATLETLKIELPKLRGKFKVVQASRIVTVPG